MFDSHHDGFGIIKKSFRKQRYPMLKAKVKTEKEEHTGMVGEGCAKTLSEGAVKSSWRLERHPTWPGVVISEVGERGIERWPLG